MTITIRAELDGQVQAAARAEGLSVEAYVERLIREDEAWPEWTEDPADGSEADWDDLRAAVEEGLAQAERGEARPAAEVFARLRERWIKR